MSKYFFFQGEGVGKISGKTGGENVKNAVQDILGFTLAKSAISDIRKVNANFGREIASADTV